MIFSSLRKAKGTLESVPFEVILNAPVRLAGVEFNDELLVGDGSDFFANRNAVHGAAHLVAINGHPVSGRGALGHFQETTDELLAALAAAAGSDDVARLALIAGDVHDLAIHGDVAMADELAGGKAGVGKAHAEHDVVETQFEHLQEVFTSHTFAALGFGEEAAELLLHETVLEAQLLLFSEGSAVLGSFAASVAGTVLSRWEIASFEGFGGAKDGNAETAVDLFARASVASHSEVGKKVRVED